MCIINNEYFQVSVPSRGIYKRFYPLEDNDKKN